MRLINHNTHTTTTPRTHTHTYVRLMGYAIIDLIKHLGVPSWHSEVCSSGALSLALSLSLAPQLNSEVKQRMRSLQNSFTLAMHYRNYLE